MRRPGRPTQALLAYLALALGVAVRRESALPAEERPWRGRALGAPYDLRRPTLRRVLAPHLDPRRPLVGAQGWGIGWCINLGRIARRLGLPV